MNADVGTVNDAQFKGRLDACDAVSVVIFGSTADSVVGSESVVTVDSVPSVASGGGWVDGSGAEVESVGTSGSDGVSGSGAIDPFASRAALLTNGPTLTPDSRADAFAA